MKKITSFFKFTLIAIGLNIFPQISNAQTMGPLWGVTSGGGDSSGGVIFKYNTLTANDSVVYGFAKTASSPIASLIQATDGNLYGMTQNGGLGGFGVVFKATTTGVVTILVNFNNTNGGYPSGSLVQATDGNLYGMTSQGGSSNKGTIFKCTTSGTLTTLVNFTGVGTNGAMPYGSLIQASDGKLYGMTSSGGSSNMGTVFKCTLAGVLTTTFNFTGTGAIGSYPQGSVMQATDGNLYGMTSQGGTAGSGTLFKCTTAGVLTTLVSFTGSANGSSPYGNLIQATDGNLYGMTPQGGSLSWGTLFRCTTTGTLTTLVNFNGGSIGSAPYGSLIQATDGNLYGATSLNGGTLFKCTLTGSLTRIDSLTAITGENPRGSLLQATDGNLYGLANIGGTAGNGTIFKSTTTGTVTNLFNFGLTVLGNTPEGSFVEGNDGNLYGTTDVGGPSNNGSIFKYNPATGSYITLVFFNGAGNGRYPDNTLVQANDGNFYGMTSNGGSSNYGTIFKCTPAGTLTTLVNFTGTNGSYPYGSLIQASDGNLYGMTSSGGSSGSGTLFRCSTSGTLTTLVNFSNGEYPNGSLVQASDGSMYGMTNSGGSSNMGSVFKCTMAGVLSTITNFTNNEYPVGSLIQAKDGNLYGMTNSGGSSNMGSIIKCTTIGTVTTLHSFTNNEYPYGSLIQANDGNLYGMTSDGGSVGDGAIFKCTTAGTYTALVNLGGAANGSFPSYTSLLELMTSSLTHTTSCSGVNIVASVKGGKSPFTYSWSTGATTSSINATAAGLYTVNVKDSAGLTLTDTLTVAYSALVATTSHVNVNCPSSHTGSVSVSASGGTVPYAYSWNTGATSSNVSALSGGIYTITVTDNAGCVVVLKDTISSNPDSLNAVHICMVTVDTNSTHNIITWDNSGLARIDSFKLYFQNSSSVWQLIQAVPYSAPNYIVDNTPINNPNSNTVRYCLTGVDSCGNEEAITASPWQNTTYIISTGGGTFTWSGTGYLIQGVAQPVQTYILLRDSLSNGNWKAIDSVAGTQNVMTDPSYALYTKARWRVDGRLIASGCNPPTLRPYKTKTYNASHSNTASSAVVTGMQNLNHSTSITVYPSPADKILNVKFDNAKSGIANVSVMDITGRVIMETQSEVGPGSVLPMNVTGLPTGIYFVKVTTNTVSQVVKFVKE